MVTPAAAATTARGTAHCLLRPSLFLRPHVRSLPSSVVFCVLDDDGANLNHQRRRYKPNAADDVRLPAKPTAPPPPVVIIGGGPTALLLSHLLSSYSVPTTLLECRSQSQVLSHPQAHFLNTRTMEILRVHAPELYGRVVQDMPEVEEWEAFRFGRSVLGREIGKVVHPVRDLGVGEDGNGVLADGGGSDNRISDNVKRNSHHRKNGQLLERVSPCDAGHLAQNKFSSLLLDAARTSALSDTSIRYGVGMKDIRVAVACRSSKGNISPFGDYGSAKENLLEVTTTDGQSILAKYVVGADGSNSLTRRLANISLVGNPSLQSLINVHFRTSPRLSERLSNHEGRAMLHFVYNEKLVGAFVCHDVKEGEWVLQVPFFPPYQTVEEDFDAEKVRRMVVAGLAIDEDEEELSCENDEGKKEEEDVNILSIRPWSMSATVAERYVTSLDDGAEKTNHQFDNRPRVILAGDAAHAFPPAGGFGMNTGVQDAHNLAWRLALLWKSDDELHKRRQRCSGEERSRAEEYRGCSGESMLSKYASERRPVAQSNAALSVRNYDRTLNLARAAYLDADHPSLLVRLMSNPPLSWTNLAARRVAFRGLVATAMAPLGSLKRAGHGHGERIRRNMRRILEEGGGLPLLFPRYELGFSYGGGGKNKPASGGTAGGEEQTTDNDTSGYVPALEVGSRMPHVPVEVLGVRCGVDGVDKRRLFQTYEMSHPWEEALALYPGMVPTVSVAKDEDSNGSTAGSVMVTLADIAEQVRPRGAGPCFALLSVAVEDGIGDELIPLARAVKKTIAKCTRGRISLGVEPIEVLTDRATTVQGQGDSPCVDRGGDQLGNAQLVVLDERGALAKLAAKSLSSASGDETTAGDIGGGFHGCFVVIRPDGYVAGVIESIGRSCAVELKETAASIAKCIMSVF